MTVTELELARSLARHLHCEQRYGVHSYTKHTEDVVSRVILDNGAYLDLQIIAYLHDVLEDTDISVTVITELFGRDIASAVVALSKTYVTSDGYRTSKPSYESYINKVKRNPLALSVKIADTQCNLAQSQLDGDTKRIEKYSKQLALLQE